MKRIALSLFVIAASGAYVWSQSGQRSSDDLVGLALPPVPQLQGVHGRETRPSITVPHVVAPDPVDSTQVDVASVRSPTSTSIAAPIPPLASPLVPAVDVPLPRLRPVVAIRPKVIHAAMTVATKGSFADGSYTGPVTDAYYGPMQIQAIVQGGRLVGIRVLEYPSDRRTSVAINRQALPMLRDEVVAAQSASVDIISGATLTSKAFIESLDAALRQATGRSL